MIDRSKKERMHPRNRFRDGYDFRLLSQSNPPLARLVSPNAYGDLSIDFADPRSVKALNQALLEQAYGLRTWDIPDGYLCPPIPRRCMWRWMSSGRADPDRSFWHWAPHLRKMN